MSITSLDLECMERYANMKELTGEELTVLIALLYIWATNNPNHPQVDIIKSALNKMRDAHWERI